LRPPVRPAAAAVARCWLRIGRECAAPFRIRVEACMPAIGFRGHRTSRPRVKRAVCRARHLCAHLAAVLDVPGVRLATVNALRGGLRAGKTRTRGERCEGCGLAVCIATIDIRCDNVTTCHCLLSPYFAAGCRVLREGLRGLFWRALARCSGCGPIVSECSPRLRSGTRCRNAGDIILARWVVVSYLKGHAASSHVSADPSALLPSIAALRASPAKFPNL
jgi:hypothetical protein